MADDKKPDPLFMWGAGIGFIALVCFLVWFLIGDQIASGTRWIRVAQLYLVSFFTSKYEPLREYLMAIPPGKISYKQYAEMNTVVNGIFRLPLSGLFLFLAWRAYNIDNKNPYSRKFDLEGLTKEHAASFPVIQPVTKFNPLKDNVRKQGDPVPAKLPSFAEALTPDEWVSYCDIPITNGKPDEDAARRAFLPQLGKRWQGALALPLYGQALFAAFAMKAGGQRLESDDFLGELASHWEPNRGLVLPKELKDKIKGIIQDPKQGRVLEKIAAQHAFTSCALLRCLHFAREQGGVLAPAQFVWLRAVDRNLWYPLNNLGRNAVHVEAAGAITHFRAEKAANKPIPNPQLDPAVGGLLKYIETNTITHYPPKDYNAK
jgi:intracellular multiplication protein IcmP